MPSKSSFKLATRVTKAKAHGKPVVMLYPTDKKRRTKKEILNKIKSIQKRWGKEKGENVMFQWTGNYDKTIGARRHGQSFGVKDEPQLWDPSIYYGDEATALDQKTFKDWALIIRALPKRVSGEDPTAKDCLWMSLYQLCNGDIPWKTPAQLKRFLKVKRRDPVPDEKLKLVSDALKANLYLEGDDEQTQSWTHPSYFKELHLKKTTEHVEPKFKAVPARGYYYPMTTRLVVRDNRGDSMVIHDGREEMTEFKEKANIIDVPMDYEGTTYEFYLQEMNKCQEFNRELARRLKNDIVDISKYKPADVAMMIFHYLTKNIPHLPSIEATEGHWIAQATIGGVIHAVKGVHEDCRSYDFESFYPNILDSKHYFPISRPTFTTLESLPDKIPMGIYRAKIKGDHPFYRFHKKQYYTNVDLQSARELDLEPELIQDGKTNAMQYPKSMRGSGVFRTFVRVLYDMKWHKVPYAKLVLNSLWGKLCERKRKAKYERSEPDISDYTDVGCIVQKNNELKFMYTDPDERFKTSFARILPFVTAYGRDGMLSMLDNFDPDNVVRVQTDGFILANGEEAIVSDKKTYHELNALYQEHGPNKEGKLKVFHCNKVRSV